MVVFFYCCLSLKNVWYRWSACSEGGFCIAGTQSQQHHRHVRCERNMSMKRMTFASSVPSHVYAGLHKLERCVAFASSVPGGVQSMKRMTFASSMPSHVYADLHKLERCAAFASSVPYVVRFRHERRVGGEVTSSLAVL